MSNRQLIALGILFAHLAIQMYRLRLYAWWVLLLLHVIGGATWAASLAGGVRFTPSSAATAACWIVYLCFLVWLRRPPETIAAASRATYGAHSSSTSSRESR